MNKTVNKIIYAAQDTARALAKESLDAFVFWLYFSYRPFRVGIMSTNFLEEVLGEHSLRQRLERLHNKGFIRKIKGHGTSFVFAKQGRFDFVSSEVGLKAENFRKGWDGKWRLVIYDIPSKRKGDRDAFRADLIALGFGKIQESCWASCYDQTKQIREFCDQRGILKNVCIYEGAFFAGKNEIALVEEAWKLNELAAAYRDIEERARALIRDVKTEDVPLREYFLKYVELFADYKALLVRDPFLPKSFSSSWSLREKAENALTGLLSNLTPGGAIKS